jgi:hypothetical protein
MTKPDLETLAGNLARASVYTGDDIGLPLKEHGAPSGSGSYGSQFVMVSVKMRDEIIAALRSYSPEAAPRSLSEGEIAALIREHVEVGYTLGDGGLVDPGTIFVNAVGAAHAIHHAVSNGQRTDPNSMDELERQGYFDDAGGYD